MANPQKENGYTAIANEILEQLMQVNLSGLKLRIALAVIRCTYGYHIKERAMSLSLIADLVSSTPDRVSKELKMLVNLNIIHKKSANKNAPQVLSFNKNYEKWNVEKVLTKRTRVDHLDYSPNGQQGIDQTGNEVLTKWTIGYCPNGQPLKKDKEIYKEMYKESVCGGLKLINHTHTAYNNILKWININKLPGYAAEELENIVLSKSEKYTEAAVDEVIRECIAENRTKIYWDRLDKIKINNTDKATNSDYSELDDMFFKLQDKL